ncbi:MAG: hypothetical protein JSV77_08270 [Dehalococcoidales bacterium]|nr:MAG: hypothetical protein JSV77_08270 [Dehalococcoidales bacterium]
MRLVARVVTLLVVPVLVLGLLLSPIVDNVSAEYIPGKGWKYRGDISLGGEVLVADAWVIEDDDTYRMWYTRLRLDESYGAIADRITSLNGPAIADAFINMDLGGLLNQLAGLSASDAAELWAFLDSITTVIGYATSPDGVNWTVENNEVLASGGSLHNGIGAPCVILDSGTYKMWYSRLETDWTTGAQLATILDDLDNPDPNVQQAAIETFLSQVRSVIGYATSADLITWTVQDNQVFPAADGDIFDSAGAPSVILDDTTYKMWYTGAKSDLTLAEIAAVLTDTDSFDLSAALNLLNGTTSFIGYATSTDGQVWTDSGEVLSGDGPIWESIGDPCVVKVTDSYEMWFSRATTDLTISDIVTLLTEISGLDLSGLWDELDNNGIEAFLTAYLAKDLTTINSLISNTSSVIAYAISDDGTTWAVEETDLTGISSNLWSSVGAPCVIGDGTNYTMWFTEGIGTLDFQSLFDLIFGAKSTIAWATHPPPSGGGGFLPPPPLPPGINYVANIVDTEGYFIKEFIALSDDGLASLTLPEGTQALKEDGDPISVITMVTMDPQPDPPTDNSVIGLVYDFDPDGATFDPPITITITYDPATLPEGVEEENLTIAMWDEDTGTWTKLPSTVDTENKTVSAQIDHFTGFAILAAHAPAAFEVSKLSITPGQVETGQVVTIAVTLSNSGDLSGTYQLELFIVGVVTEVREVTLGGGESTVVYFEVIRSAARSYTVSVGGFTGIFIVEEGEVIEPPEPEPEPEADIVTNELSATAAVIVGETVTIDVVVANRGEGEGSYEVILLIDGNVIESRTVTLAGNSEQTVTFTTIAATTGLHTVDVDDLSTIFVVSKKAEIPEEPSHLNWWFIGGIIGGCAVLTAAATIFLLRRRMA